MALAADKFKLLTRLLKEKLTLIAVWYLLLPTLGERIVVVGYSVLDLMGVWRSYRFSVANSLSLQCSQFRVLGGLWSSEHQSFTDSCELD